VSKSARFVTAPPSMAAGVASRRVWLPPKAPETPCAEDLAAHVVLSIAIHVTLCALMRYVQWQGLLVWEACDTPRLAL
jgi:hypothetical protein